MSKTNLTNTMLFKGIRSMVKPKGLYDDLPIPAAPDYAQIENWAAHPTLDNGAKYVPKGSKPTPESDKEVDVFYIHPTSSFTKNYWNTPLDLPKAKELIDHMTIPGQASVFNVSCRVFAPRYRQVTFYCFLDATSHSRKAFNLAYGDVKDAFLHYMKYENNGRPFIIAGHSQGTSHGIRLLEECIDQTVYFENFIAAYLLGFQVPLDKIGTTLQNIKPATSAFDSKCIIAWDTFLDDATIPHDLDNCEHFYPDIKTWELRSNKPIVSINPISWKVNEDLIPAQNHIGACRVKWERGAKFDLTNFYNDEAMGLVSTGLSKPYLHEVSTQLDKEGFLRISKPLNRVFSLGALPGGNYHPFDYALFYMHIRQNVKARVDYYLMQKQAVQEPLGAN